MTWGMSDYPGMFDHFYDDLEKEATTKGLEWLKIAKRKRDISFFLSMLLFNLFMIDCILILMSLQLLIQAIFA